MAADENATHDPTDDELDVPESPATWENVVVGKAKEALGHLIGDQHLVAEGEEQEHIAHEVRQDFRAEHEN